MQNRFEQSEDGSYVIYAPRQVNGKPLEGFEVPFYISSEDIERVDSMPGVWYAVYNNGEGKMPYIIGSSEKEKLHRWIYEGRKGER